MMCLNYVSNGNSIKHALNGGEKELTIGNKTYKEDGFCEETNTNSMVAFGMDVQIATNPVS